MSKCPICDKPRVYETRPFCSIRCKQIDLGRWFTGQYTIPVLIDDLEEEEVAELLEEE